MTDAKVFDTDELMRRESVHDAPSLKKIVAIVIPLLILVLFILSPYQ